MRYLHSDRGRLVSGPSEGYCTGQVLYHSTRGPPSSHHPAILVSLVPLTSLFWYRVSISNQHSWHLPSTYPVSFFYSCFAYKLPLNPELLPLFSMSSPMPCLRMEICHRPPIYSLSYPYISTPLSYHNHLILLLFPSLFTSCLNYLIALFFQLSHQTLCDSSQFMGRCT